MMIIKSSFRISVLVYYIVLYKNHRRSLKIKISTRTVINQQQDSSIPRNNVLYIYIYINTYVKYHCTLNHDTELFLIAVARSTTTMQKAAAILNSAKPSSSSVAIRRDVLFLFDTWVLEYYDLYTL